MVTASRSLVPTPRAAWASTGVAYRSRWVHLASPTGGCDGADGGIGLRRAIGATRRHIAAQFLLESASMGVVGGLLGASVGVLIVVGVAAYQVWTPVLEPLAPLLASAFGGTIIFCMEFTPPCEPPDSNRRRRSGLERE